MELSGAITVVEHLPDGRQLVASEAHPGVLVVTGVSNREPVAARMGYGRTRTPVRVRPNHVPRRVVPPGPTAAVRAAEAALGDRLSGPQRRAQALFLSLLNERQRAQWERHERCWVDTPRGPVRLGQLHDLRFRPAHTPGQEWSLCVVTSGPPLPLGDVWTNLLLVLSANPDEFFRVANVQTRSMHPSYPDPWD